ncbi:MAG TPA: RNA 2',3'-cyclic phosphodiesterase [Ktedonobacterales bacterium]|nr:RNA 2',3'-cyclic phosphodiesterase [Ktedonobacterales bacterium]
MTRTFIAVELGQQARAALTVVTRELAAALPGVRFVDPASLHLTLAFLGELDGAQLDQAREATAATAAENEPFELALAGLGVFGPRRAPRVIWAGVAGDTARLLALQRLLAAKLATRGFALEERQYSPHLTLARLKRPPDASELTQLERLLNAPVVDCAPIPVDALSVMKSELAPSGARYTCLRRLPLTRS